MPLVGDEFTATFANDGALSMSSQPRPTYNNNPTAQSHGTGQSQWENWYGMVSSANEGLSALDRGVILEDAAGTDQSPRARAFALMMRGVGYGYLGMLFDKAYVVDENSDLENLPPYSPYPEVRDTAVKMLENAIAEMEANSFELPDTWIQGVPLSNAELAQLAHSYIARILVYTARTPEERRNVDWTKVLYHLDRGITTDHAPVLDYPRLMGTLWFRYELTGAASLVARGHYKVLGPADISGAYQNWLQTPLADRIRFDIITPDRRITGATDDPTSAGKYYRYLSDDDGFNAARGTYHFSAYQGYRRRGNIVAGPAVIMSKAEMDLIRAEAYLFQGKNQEAADLINIRRVAVGEHPPVMADGVPAGGECVPRTDTGDCGDLWDALRYERGLELAGLDALRSYLDRRGFGTLTCGTFLHFPVPGQELGATGQQIYTFGGVGGTMASTYKCD
jgi:hypothetical protein